MDPPSNFFFHFKIVISKVLHSVFFFMINVLSFHKKIIVGQHHRMKRQKCQKIYIEKEMNIKKGERMNFRKNKEFIESSGKLFFFFYSF
jgi:hypothetical protein